LKSLGQKRPQLVFRIYALPLRRVNAAKWCSAVDIGGKKDFIPSQAKREIPAAESIQTLYVRWPFSEFSGTLLQEQTCVPFS
jgi:hypothetical protein